MSRVSCGPVLAERIVTLGSGCRRLRVDAVVDDRDAGRADRSGTCRAGSAVGATAASAASRAPSCMAFLAAGARSSPRCDREFGIEIEVLALGRVIIFEIGDMAGLGPDVLQKQVLAPAGIDHHHIGLEALFGQLAGPVRDAIGAAQARDDGGIAVLVRRVLGTGDGIVGEILHARDRALLAASRGPTTSCPSATKLRRQAQELARKILVNEERIFIGCPCAVVRPLRPRRREMQPDYVGSGKPAALSASCCCCARASREKRSISASKSR